jgi:hypothetical protein
MGRHQDSSIDSEATVAYVADQQGVHPTSGSLRVFKQFTWLEVDSVKLAFSLPAHLPLTRAVGWAPREIQ